MKRLKRRLSAAFYRVHTFQASAVPPSNSHHVIMAPDGSDEYWSIGTNRGLDNERYTRTIHEDPAELSEGTGDDSGCYVNGSIGFSTIDEDRVWSRASSTKSASTNLSNGRSASAKFLIGSDVVTNGYLPETRSYQSRLNRAVVQEHPVMGSDGESEDASGTSDEVVSSPGAGSAGPNHYISANNVHVKMRQKPTRRYSEQDIQKRLSLPADLRLPLSVVERLNRTPTLDQPLSRKSRRISLSEIGFGKIESYQKLEKLGEGTYATVFKGRSRLTEGLVALKEIRLEHEEGAPCTAIREVSLLRDLRHANVVTLHDIIHTEKTLTLVFEYVDRDLKQYMDECGNILSMNNVRIFLFQLLRGLAYCHQRRVLHRDLKPQNLLINARGELKLADFGLARAKSVPTKTYSNEVVTLWYRPVDVLLGSIDYSTHIDMWGVGCILYEMAAGRPFFPGSSVDEQLHLIFRALGSPSEEIHPDLYRTNELREHAFPIYRAEPLVNHAPRLDVDGLDLLARLLQYVGRKRISAKDAGQHPFFSSLGPLVHRIPDIESIFTIPGIALTRDPGYRPHHHGPGSRIDYKHRRQSMLL